MMDPLVRAFLDLSGDDQRALVAEAKRRSDRGVCFLCRWVVEKMRIEDFPREGRMKHLMLCCAPIRTAVTS